MVRTSGLSLLESRPLFPVIVWSLILLLAILLLFLVMTYMRNRVRRSDDFAGTGFTLGGLRELHRWGQLSDEEYARAKAQLLGPRNGPKGSCKPGLAPEKPYNSPRSDKNVP